MLQTRINLLSCFFLVFFVFVISSVKATTWEKAGSFPYQVSSTYFFETEQFGSEGTPVFDAEVKGHLFKTVENVGVLISEERPRSAMASPQPTQFSAPGEEVTVDLIVQFGTDAKVEMLNALKVSFTLTYTSSVLVLKEDLSSCITPAPGWVFAGAGVEPNAVTITLANISNTKLSSTQSLGTINFNLLKTQESRTMVGIKEIRIQTNRQIFPFTFKQGADYLQFIKIDARNSINQYEEAKENMRILPHLAQNRMTVNYTIPKLSGSGVITLVDVSGNVVKSYLLKRKEAQSGTHSVDISLTDCANGTYTVKFACEDLTMSGSLRLVR